MSHLNGDTLGHNPNATQEELLKFREGFVLSEHFNGAVPQPKATDAPVVITKAQVIELARAYGLDLIASNPVGGRTDNLEEKYEALKADRDSLSLRLLDQNAKVQRAEKLAHDLATRNHELAAEIVKLKARIEELYDDGLTDPEARSRPPQENPNVS